MKITWNKEIKRALRGYQGNAERKLTLDTGVELELTRIEYLMLRHWIWQMHSRGRDKLPTLIPISERYHLDFIGWDNPKQMDVLLCKNGRRWSF